MKKRSLFKRLLSGFVATALAATICFGDRVFEDLFASAAGEAQTVNVDFYDGETLSPVVKEEGDNTNYKYFVLGALVDKDAGPKVAATAAYVDQFIAWDCIEIDPEAAAHSTVVFDKFYMKHADYKNNYDRKQPVVEFDSSKYKLVTRVYRYWVTRQNVANPYWKEDTTNPHATDGVEPTNLISPEGEFLYPQYSAPQDQFRYNEQSADTIPGYAPISNETDGNSTTIKFGKKYIEFYVDVNFSKKTTVTANDNLYVLAEVEHKNHDHTYFYKQVIADQANLVRYTVQDKENHHWIKEGYSTEDPHERYNGNEPAKIRLFKATEEMSLTTLLSGTNCTELKTGDFVKAQKVRIDGLSSDPEEPDATDVLVKYYDTVTLLKPDVSDNYDFLDILGSGVAFGITADRFVQADHAQTNFAANYFKDEADNVDVDLSSPSAGEIYVANFANLTTPNDTSADDNGKVVVGDTKGMVLNVNVPDKNRVKLHKEDMAQLGTVVINQVDADKITNNVINPTIAQMQSMSNRLASKPANVTPVVTSSHIIIDSMDYDDGATIYVDGDALAGLKDPQNPDKILNFKFVKKEGQTIVINYTKTRKVDIREFTLEVTDKEGNVTKGDSSPDGLRGSKQNNWLDQQVMRKIVWNLNSVINTQTEFETAVSKDDVKTPCVTFANTAGVFLIPNARTVATSIGTSSGWIVTAGYFSNVHGEWHFPYSGLNKYKAPESTEVVISKKSITSEKELQGAQLQIVDKQTGKNIGDAIWQYLIEVANTGVEAVKTMVAPMQTVRTGMKWTSTGTEKTIVLRDGSYTLKETGTTFVSPTDGKTYKVVKSSYDFEITGGRITKVSKNVKEDNGTITFKDNTITISDASADGPIVHYVDINKTDITGKTELAGATLTIYKLDADGKRDTSFTPLTRTSAKDSTWSVALQSGSYELVETGNEIKDDNGYYYKVLTSSVFFTVDDNGQVSATSANTKTAVDAGSSDSYALVKNPQEGTPSLTICDALRENEITISKKDITGEEEIANARLVIKDSNNKVVADWTSKGDGNTLKVTLKDGKYTLTETAAEDKSGKYLDITDNDGNTYNVLPSVVEFEVKNGQVVSSSKLVKDDIKSIDQTTGGIVADGSTMKICDAIKTAKVTITKTDIAGSTEIKGAKLTLFDAGNKQVGDSWISNENGNSNVWTVSLAPGKYTLKEDANSVVTDGDTEYKVIPSAYEFTVGADGKVVETKAVTGSEGEIALTGDNAITVNDAIRYKTVVEIDKKNIAGDEELENAMLTLTDANGKAVKDTNGKTVKPWKSVIGKSWKVSLDDGTYRLRETGDDFVSGGKTYTVVASVLEFKIVGGQIVSTKVIEGNKQTKPKSEFDKDAAKGYYHVNGNKFTVCDAEAAEKTVYVHINKTDITGDKELTGAVLTLRDEAGELVESRYNPWTSQEGAEFVVALKDGKYTLKESAAVKDGKKVPIVDGEGREYEVLESTITFEIENGKVKNCTVGENAAKTDFDSVSKDGDAVVTTNKDGEAVITICDAATPEKTYKVTLNKKDVTGEEELDGATLTVKDSDGNVVAKWTSQKGKTKTMQLTNGTYTLEESGNKIVDSEGNEYDVIGSTVTFEVKDGKVISKGAKTTYDKDAEKGYVYLDENHIVICDAKKPAKTTKVTLNKKDITGEEELDGAVLTVKDKDGKTVAEWTSVIGETKTVELENGTYTLEESGTSITDSEGNEYDVIGSTVTFEVKDGKVTVTGAKTTYDKDAEEGYVYQKDNTIEICDAKKPATQTKYPVVLNKKDVTGEEELDGAKLTVKDSDGKTVAEWTSKKGKTKTIQLANGTYTLEESGDKIVDSEGNEYDVIGSTVKFTVEDGKVTVEGAKTTYDKDAEEGYVYQKGKTIVICDAKKPVKTTKVTLNKKDITGEEELDGAVLTVKDKDGKTVVEWTSKIGETKTVELEDGEYTLEESGTKITDKDGNEYDVIGSTVKFTVEGGKVTSKSAKSTYDEDAEEGYLYVKGTTVVVCDAKKATAEKKYPVVLNKTDITGDKELAGARLTVYDAAGKKVASWDSVIGKTKTIQLADGKYTLKETFATDDAGNKKNIIDENGKTYSVIESEFEFTVAMGMVVSPQAVTSFDDVPANGSVVVDDNTITVCDAVNTTKVKISKTDITGETELAGATLTITGNGVSESWTSNGKDVWEIELEDGTYTLKESGKEFTDKATKKTYKVITTAVKFKVTNGKVVAADSKSVDDVSKVSETEGGVVIDGSDEIKVCDAEKTEETKPSQSVSTPQSESESQPTGSVSTKQSGTEPSQSVSTPKQSESESQPTGSVSTKQSGTEPSQSVSTPKQSESQPTGSVSTPASSEVKPTSSKQSSASTEGTSGTKKTSGTKGTTPTEETTKKGTTTKKTTTQTSSESQPDVTTTTGSNGGNNPQTGHTGSTVTVAALLAAVAALAIFKKKDEE